MQGWSAYTWVSAYFVIISVEMAYGKHIVGPHLGLKSMWGPTMYTNVLSIVPMSMAGALSHEHERLAQATWSVSLVALLAISCVIGVAISYTGWKCRSMVTATCFTVLGVANKMATVLVNCLIWDKHASLLGAASLCVCLVGGSRRLGAVVCGGEKKNLFPNPFKTPSSPATSRQLSPPGAVTGLKRK